MTKSVTLRAAIGIRAHSGWAAIVAVAGAPNGRGIELLDRRRVEVIEAKGPRANQPYHHAQTVSLDEAQIYLQCYGETAVRLATEQLLKLEKSLRSARYKTIGCAVLQAASRTLPELPRILASHPLIHTAEGQFFRNVFAAACEKIHVPVVKVRERELLEVAVQGLRLSAPKIASQLAELGREVGPPWTQDQKLATLAAWLVLRAKRAA